MQRAAFLCMKELAMRRHESIEFRPITIPKENVDTFLATEDPIGVMGLYIFYYYTAIWQKTNTIKATTSYAAKALRCSENKIRKIRRILLEIDWIEDIVRRDANGQSIGRFIKVRYYTSKPTIEKNHTQGLPQCGHLTANAYSNNSNCRGGKSRDGQRGVKRFDRLATKYLHDLILSHKNINLNTSSWPNTFRLVWKRL
jgi:hypothetical protein